MNKQNQLQEALSPEAEMLPTGPVRMAVISNRGSGHNRDRFDRVAALFEGCSNIDHYPTGSAAELPGVLQTIVASDPDVLVINGGDGTAAAIFAQLLEHSPFAVPPAIALLPGGTANMTAGDIGLKGPLIRAAERLCSWGSGVKAAPAKLISRRILRVQPGRDQAAHYGTFFGAGAVIQGTEYAHRNIHSRGLRDDFSLGLGAVRTIWGVARGDEEFDRPLPVKLRMAEFDAEQCHDVRVLAVSSLERLFMGFHPFWGEGDGAVKVSLVTREARHLLRRFPFLLRGRPSKGMLREPGYYSYNTDQLQLEMDSSFNLDGEIVQVHPDNGPVTITAAGPLTFLKLP